MTPTEALSVLRAIQSHHTTDQGVEFGFTMKEATAALGSLAQATDTVATLVVAGLVDSVPALIGGEVHTICRLAETTQPASRSVH